MSFFKLPCNASKNVVKNGGLEAFIIVFETLQSGVKEISSFFPLWGSGNEVVR